VVQVVKCVILIYFLLGIAFWPVMIFLYSLMSHDNGMVCVIAENYRYW